MNPRRSSLFALIAGAIAIGFAPIFVRWSLREIGPSATAFWRITLALPVLLAWAARDTMRAPGGPTPRGRPCFLVALAGGCFAGDLALWHWSIHFTSVANATLEANLASIFVVLIGWIWLRQPVSRRFILAMAIALAGTALLVGRNVHLGALTLRGDALGVLTAVFYAGYLLAVKAARERGLRTSTIMAAGGVITAAVLLPIASLSGERLLPTSASGWWVLFGLAWFSHAGGQSLIAYALAGLPAAFASVGLLVQPATAALAAWIILGEGLAPLQGVGGVLLLAGILIARRES